MHSRPRTLLACAFALTTWLASCNMPTSIDTQTRFLELSRTWGTAEWDRFAVYSYLTVSADAAAARDLAAFGALTDAANRGDRGAIDWLIDALWGGDAPQMRAIVQRESNYLPWAKNPRSSASGLTQLLDLHAHRFTARGWTWDTGRFDALQNLVVAHDLWSEARWSPWRCC